MVHRSSCGCAIEVRIGIGVPVVPPPARGVKVGDVVRIAEQAVAIGHSRFMHVLIDPDRGTVPENRVSYRQWARSLKSLEMSASRVSHVDATQKGITSLGSLSSVGVRSTRRCVDRSSSQPAHEHAK
jgi:hypothetical protein